MNLRRAIMISLTVVRSVPACFVMVAAIHATASAEVIAFDDAYMVLSDGGDPNDFYATPDFVGPYFGLVGGLGYGDPGNWGIEGTAGSAFWGFNVDVGGGLVFAGDFINFSLDVS